MEVLDLRTYRDLQYVRDTENLMKTVDGKLKTASENPRSLNPKSFQVLKHIQPKKKRLKTTKHIRCALSSHNAYTLVVVVVVVVVALYCH